MFQKYLNMILACPKMPGISLNNTNVCVQNSLPKKYPKVPQSTQKYLKVTRGTPKYPEQPQITQNYLKVPQG